MKAPPTTVARRRPVEAPVPAPVTAAPVSALRNLAGPAGRLLATLLLAAAVLALLGMTVGPRVLHYRTATMLTASMAPKINPGDVVVDTLEPIGAIRVGQIITYRIPVQDHRVESHRVMWVGHDPHGTVLIRTKGDANAAADPWTARMDDAQAWRVRAVIPVAGKMIRWLRQPIPHRLLTGVLPLALVAWLLASIWRPTRDEPDDQPERQPENESEDQAQPEAQPERQPEPSR